MATTFTWQDVYNRVAGDGFRAREDAQLVFAVNDAQYLIWDLYDWRETLEELPPFWLVANCQEYGEVPGDFQALRKAYLVNVDSNYGRDDIRIKKDLSLTNIRDLPKLIGYAPETHKFRVWPRPNEGLNPTQFLIDGQYKKKPTKVTHANVGSSLIPWDDRHFRVCCTALQWALTPELSESKPKIFMAALMQITDMASKEGLDLGDPVGVSPVEPLVRDWGVR
jgi:hypothetical protein